jgi:cystathionine gamma-synthase
MELKLGMSLPPGDPHGISVSLPRWKDTVGWANRDEQVLQQMDTGYPRFFVPRIVRELASRIVHNTLSGLHEELDIPFSLDDEKELDALLVPARAMSVQCKEYLQSHAPNDKFLVVAFTMEGVHSVDHFHEVTRNGTAQIYAVMFKGSTSEGEPKAFWQHTGFGISSRCASYWLSNASCLRDDHRIPDELPQIFLWRNAQCKIRQRIAHLLSSPSISVPERDVWLFHTGMSAITHSAQLLSTTFERTISVAVFG